MDSDMSNSRRQLRDEPPGRFLEIAEREVGRIILDIHDGPVQNIFAALSQLYVLQRGQDQRQSASDNDQERLRRAISLLELALTDIRTFLGTFRPPEFQRRDILSILEGLVIQHEELTGNPVELVVSGELPSAPLPVKISLYRILQEALSNAVRHGEADRHRVELRGDTSRVVMEISDQGRGFDVVSVMEQPLQGHFGLEGMRERVHLLDGIFCIESTPGKGTQIRVEIPVIAQPAT
jgi:signal transduction histidine kinase